MRGHRIVFAALFLAGCSGNVVVGSDGSQGSSNNNAGSNDTAGSNGAAGGSGAAGATGTAGAAGDGVSTGTAGSSGGGSDVTAPLTISAPGARDMVHDAKRHRLYITTSSGGWDATDGQVLNYNLLTQQLEAPLLTGGSFRGIDLSPDQDRLIVADEHFEGTQNWVYSIDLNAGAAQKIPFDLQFGEAGTFTAVFTSDVEVLVTSSYAGSGDVPLRKVDLKVGAAQILRSVVQDTMLAVSADGSTVAYAQSNSSNGPWGHYDVATGTFDDSPGLDWFLFEIAASPKGTQFAIPTYNGMFVYDGDSQKALIGKYADELPVGAVYSPVKDELYLAWYGSTVSIDVYSPTTLKKLRDIEPQPGFFDNNGNHAFDNGRIRVSRDGAAVFATTVNETVVAYPTGP